jgi:hypothetical protein
MSIHERQSLGVSAHKMHAICTPLRHNRQMTQGWFRTLGVAIPWVSCTLVPTLVFGFLLGQWGHQPDLGSYLRLRLVCRAELLRTARVAVSRWDWRLRMAADRIVRAFPYQRLSVAFRTAVMEARLSGVPDRVELADLTSPDDRAALCHWRGAGRF